MQVDKKVNLVSVKVHNESLYITIKDEFDYIISIAVVPFDVIIRTSYNAVLGHLDIWINQTIGSIVEQPVYQTDNKGKRLTTPGGEPLDDIRYAIQGKINGFQITLDDPDIIRKVMIYMLNTKSDKEFDSVFEGFRAFEKAKIKLAEMKKRSEAQAKQKGENPNQDGKIVNIHGKEMKSETEKPKE